MKKILEVVNLYKNRTPNRVLPEFNLLQLAVDGFRELNIISLDQTNIKVKDIAVENGIVPMPDDYIQYTKVGVAAGNKLWTLTVNTELLPPEKKYNECGVSYEEARSGKKTTEEGWHFVPHVDKNGIVSGGMYALGGGWNSKGYFKEDFENRRFLLDQVSSDVIVLEYKSSGVSIDSYVPDVAVEALIAWLRWQESMADAVGINRAGYFQSLFQNQVEKIEYELNPLRIDEYLDTLYVNVHQGLKR